MGCLQMGEKRRDEMASVGLAEEGLGGVSDGKARPEVMVRRVKGLFVCRQELGGRITQALACSVAAEAESERLRCELAFIEGTLAEIEDLLAAVPLAVSTAGGE